MPVERVGVIGAGVIGKGVAQDLAQTGHEVVLVDVSDEILEDARDELTRAVRFHHLVASGAERQNTAEVMGRVTLSTDYGDLALADFVVENVTEDWHVKKDVFRELDRSCKAECILATNTSAIPVTALASETRRAPRVLGMHFMNPVPLKRTVEVIRGAATSDETLETAAALLARMDKEAIVVNDSPGFVSNRVLMLTINEAIRVLEDKVAGPRDIDDIFRKCFGHSMGPLETGDLIGLDTVLKTLAVLRDAFGDDRFEPSGLLKKMVDEGRLGRKTGRGFFDYAAGMGDAVERE